MKEIEKGENKAKRTIRLPCKADLSEEGKGAGIEESYVMVKTKEDSARPLRSTSTPEMGLP